MDTKPKDFEMLSDLFSYETERICPEVSVVIPTRNRAKILERTLAAFCEQQFPGFWEIIVADDGSTDGTADLVRRFSLSAPKRVVIRYVRSQGRGANAARNTAIKLARGQTIVLSDDDVLVPPDWLEKLTAPIREGKAEVAAGPVILEPSLRLPGKHPGELAALVAHVPEVTIPMLGNMAVNRCVFNRGLFDPTIEAPVEETEWLERVKASWVAVPEAPVIHLKDQKDLQFLPLARLAWRRGLSGGKYAAKRGKAELRIGLITALRALGHALRHRCVGGILIAISCFGRAVGALLVAIGDRRD
jgi:glycosyltransferase involved in cell wall biosynthesis